MEKAIQKLQLLGPAAQWEAAEDVNLTGDPVAPCSRTPKDLLGGVSSAVLPNGQRIPLLKTLVSSVCEMDCKYCAFRSGRDTRRETFSPDELAYLSQALFHKGIVKGVFLSSGLVGGGSRAQDRIIATAEIMRKKYRFPGYLHIKIMPGAEREQVIETMRYADRVSLNLEAPNAKRLADLAPRKHDGGAMITRLKWVHEIRRDLGPQKKPSVTTQFVVGAVGETDLELMLTSWRLFTQWGLARAYYSGFNPVPDTPLENLPATQLKREARLYQASFLLRDYAFDVEELPFDPEGNLPLDRDPKLAWAEQNLSEKPVEVNTADRHMLMRVPGIGSLGASRILHERRKGTLQNLSDLQKLGIRTGKVAPFILLDGRQSPRQLAFSFV